MRYYCIQGWTLHLTGSKEIISNDTYYLLGVRIIMVNSNRDTFCVVFDEGFL